MKMWLLLSRFELGGLERVQSNLAPSFSDAGLDVWIVAGQFLAGTERMLPQGIGTLEIAPHGKMAFIPTLLSQLRLQKPDMVITTSNDVGCLMLVLRALFFPNMKVICTQHLSVSAPWKKARGLQRAKHHILLALMQHLWPKSDAIIAVSSALADDMRSTLKLRSAIHVIHNPIVLPDFHTKMQQPILWPWADFNISTLVFVGRLAKVKRLDILLNAFSQVLQTHKARLLILGDGPEREYADNFVRQNKLNNVCSLAGHQDNPLPWIKSADILILPSDYEGFGNVLVEAMACGTQVVATDCPHGPAEILDYGKYGQLVPTNDANALSHAIKQSLSRKFHVPIQDLVKRASKFNLEPAVKAYLRVIQEVAKKT